MGDFAQKVELAYLLQERRVKKSEPNEMTCLGVGGDSEPAGAIQPYGSHARNTGTSVIRAKSRIYVPVAPLREGVET